MQSKIEGLKVGADPELFLMRKDDGRPAIAIGLIGGTKDVPIPVTKRGHALQEDNVAVEFCIPPSTSANQLNTNIEFMLEHIKTIIPEELTISQAASARFTEEDLDSPQAQMFGCDPSYNHWTDEINVSPEASGTLRTCGGHIHIGYDNPTNEMSRRILAAMELYLGVPSIIMDKDTERRKMYGKSGEFRYKPYGCEFRVLSNFWIFNRMHRNWVFGAVKDAVEFVEGGRRVSSKLKERIIKCINEADSAQALEICEEYGIHYFTHKDIKRVSKTTAVAL